MFKTIAGFLGAGLALASFVLASTTGWAAAVRTSDQAADQVHANGFGLISKADKTAYGWDVWTSKDGIPYRVSIDAESGLVLAARPVQDND